MDNSGGIHHRKVAGGGKARGGSEESAKDKETECVVT